MILKKIKQAICRCFMAAVAWLLLVSIHGMAADQLEWNREKDRVTADITGQPLTNLLERLTVLTGWQIFMEPDTRHIASAKFKDQPAGEALRRLFGPLSYALIPRPGEPAKLLVFRTSMEEATQRIVARPEAAAGSSRIKDELIVTLKPGQSIDELAKQLGAKVTGSAKGLNAYRLKFENEAAANAAREALRGNANVASVDNNYWINRPADGDALQLAAGRSLNLKARPLGDGNPIVVGLIDTGVQSLGKDLDAFVLKGVSVAGESLLPTDQPTHGTTMAYTILSGLSQLLPEDQASKVRLVWVDVYGGNPQTTTFEVGLGTYEAINAGANIINYSLGGDGDSGFLRTVIQSAAEKGIIPIAAAGNAPGTAATYPAAFPEVVAITAGDRQGQIAVWANSGDFVDGVAPGSSIVPFAGRSYYVSGTSTATALASGYAAALADKTGKSAAEVQELLLSLIGVKKP